MTRQDAERNREAVIEAALGLLSSGGSASMLDIARASGVGRTTVYRHFPTREHLLAALQGVAVEHARREATAVFAREASFEETMHELSSAMVGTGARYRFMLSSETVVSDELAAARRSPESPIRAYFRACQQRGEIREDLPLDWIMSAFQSLSLVAMQDHEDGRRDKETATRCLAESLIGMLRAA